MLKVLTISDEICERDELALKSIKPCGGLGNVAEVQREKIQSLPVAGKEHEVNDLGEAETGG